MRDAVAIQFDTLTLPHAGSFFGEADGFPGLVIDKFSDVLVVESLALGIDKMKLMIIDSSKLSLRQGA